MWVVGIGVRRDESGTETGTEPESETDLVTALPLIAGAVPAQCFLPLSLSQPAEDVPPTVAETESDAESDAESETETEAGTETDPGTALPLITDAVFWRCFLPLPAVAVL